MVIHALGSADAGLQLPAASQTNLFHVQKEACLEHHAAVSTGRITAQNTPCSRHLKSTCSCVHGYVPFCRMVDGNDIRSALPSP